MGFVKKNPIAKMPRPTPEPREDFVPQSKFNALIRACGTDQLRELVKFLLETVCRVQEIPKLEARYFDGQKFVLPIKKSKGKRRQRAIYLTSYTIPMVKRLCKKWETGQSFALQETRRGTRTTSITQ